MTIFKRNKIIQWMYKVPLAQIQTPIGKKNSLPNNNPMIKRYPPVSSRCSF